MSHHSYFKSIFIEGCMMLVKDRGSPKFEFEICFFTSCVSLGWWFNHICKVGLITPTLQDYFEGGML